MAVIGIFDSGSGGLSVLKEIRKVLPCEHYVYYSDNAHCPYGEKSQEYIVDRARFITELLVEKGAQAIVVACNTATAAAIATLRQEYDIPFVGMEPAVKPAALGTRTGVIGVLATAGTLSASKYLSTRGRFEDDVQILERVGDGFVELVENLVLEGPEAERVVRAGLLPLVEAGADTIVLGCTHYPFLLPVMEKVCAATPSGLRVKFIDPAPAVARHLADVLRENGIPTEDSAPGVELLSSGPADTLKSLFFAIFAK